MTEPLKLEIPAQPSFIDKIYKEKLTSGEKQGVDEQREFYKQNDSLVFEEIQAIRNEIGTIEGWKTTKEKAKQELTQIPDDILEKLFKRFTPFIKNLPPGHSKGHLLRDSVYLTTIFQDPDIKNYDTVEIFVGILGGYFHDIGNSVVNRYEEQRNFSGHAEIGAHLFGLTAKGLIGENLIKMTQLAIAAHTHYTKDRVVTKNGETKTTRPYEDEIIEGNRMALWWTRQSDRNDIQGPIGDVRHFMTKTEPTEDFDGKEFHTTWENPEDDFRHQFTPVLRTPAERAAKPKPENTQNNLEHVIMFARSNFNPALPYGKYDNPTLQGLMVTAAEEQHEFVTDVLSETPVISKEQRDGTFEKFFKLCEIVEPSQTTDEVIGKLRTKFQLLSEKDQSKWANGFNSLVERLYPRMWQRIAKILEKQPQEIKDKDSIIQTKIQKIVSDDLSLLAKQIWESFNPSQLKSSK